MFFTSAVVLTIEILAGRLLAPYVGVTLETYTGIIGTVLAGIATGTWLGGRLADQFPGRRLLPSLLIVGGGLALLIVPIVRVTGSAVGRGPDISSIVILAAGSFFLPAAVLSAVTPVVVKLELSDLAVTGRTVGRVSAAGTVGAIFGTFVTGFVLVASVPTRAVIIGLGIALVILGGVLALSNRGNRGADRAAAAALVLAVAAGVLTTTTPPPCPRQTVYYCAEVVRDPGRPGGRTLILDTQHNSYVDLDDPAHLEFRYAQVLALVVESLAPEPAPLAALHIGGGGFTLPRYIEATRPGSTSLVLEVDRLVVEVARQELGLVTGSRSGVEVAAGDARTGLLGVATSSADLVIGDAFSGLTVPWHLTTREFVSEIKRVLRPRGLYALNLIDYPPLEFARSEVATIRSVFPDVAVIAQPAQLAGRGGGNFVVVAGDRIGSIDLTGRSERAMTGDELDRLVAGAGVLSDDFAPVDQMLRN